MRCPRVRKLSKIREDVKFYDEFSSLIETSKTIALSEFRALEKKIRTFERFVKIVEFFFGLIEARNIRHPFVNPEGRPQCVVMITSDAGLSGGLDAKITAGAINLLETPQDKLISVGTKGRGYAEERGIPFVDFPGVQDEKRFAQAMELRNYIAGEVLNGGIGPVKVVYGRPFSIIVQRVEVLRLLPCSEQIRGGAAPGDIIMESAPWDIVEYLVYLWMGQKLFEVFGLSRLAEVAARFMHAEDSSQKIKETSGKLRIELLRARHEVVDQQMRELFAARG